MIPPVWGDDSLQHTAYPRGTIEIRVQNAWCGARPCRNDWRPRSRGNTRCSIVVLLSGRIRAHIKCDNSRQGDDALQHARYFKRPVKIRVQMHGAAHSRAARICAPLRGFSSFA
jgi:hypothetical protein